ncbi:Xylose isomerase domain protein TIM barrel [Arcticibacter svalbardensis MN12-7]|uniref:Xylose isomerase domain protein TIM barrel n=2 Tax=Arcticibacter TaxID=1288026 RepID=R9GVC1_9SPHI|nr:Xylose isomerase domain protein TIM barrel [Arcticibacter svalbardensis MN12-7]
MALPSTKKVGLQLYTLRDELPKDPRKVIAQVAAAGYKEVELFGYADNKFWGLSPQELQQVLKSNELHAISGHYDFTEFLGPDGKMDKLNSYIEAATILKHQYLVVPYLADNLRQTADDYRKLADKFNQAAAICKKAGLQFGYHNHAFEFQDLNGVIGYETLLKETDPDLVKFEMDLYWVVKAGKDPVEMFKEYPGKFSMWHVKDMDKTDSTKNTEIGNGSIDYKKIFASAKLAGLEHCIVEQENFAIDPFVSIKESATYTTKVLIPELG